MDNALGLWPRLLFLSPLAFLLSLGACESGMPEAIELRAEQGVGGSVLFSWDSGPMHMLRVTRCLSDCNGCGDDGTLDNGSAEMIWEAAQSPISGEPQLTSPMTYGNSTDHGGAGPQPLISGETYSAELWLGDPCDETGCAIALQGCTEFVAP